MPAQVSEFEATIQNFINCDFNVNMQLSLYIQKIESDTVHPYLMSWCLSKNGQKNNNIIQASKHHRSSVIDNSQCKPENHSFDNQWKNWQMSIKTTLSSMICYFWVCKLKETLVLYYFPRLIKRLDRLDIFKDHQ